VLAAPPGSWPLRIWCALRNARGKARQDLRRVAEPAAATAFRSSHNALTELLEFTTAQRKTMKRRDARHIVADLFDWLEVYLRAPEQDREYVGNAWRNSSKSGKPKATRASCRNSSNTSIIFEQAGGAACLEDDAPAMPYA